MAFADSQKTTNTAISIEGMSCNHCVMSVTKALSEIDGVKSVNVSLDKGEASIEYNPESAKIDDFVQAIEEAGYKVLKSDVAQKKK